MHVIKRVLYKYLIIVKMNQGFQYFSSLPGTSLFIGGTFY